MKYEQFEAVMRLNGFDIESYGGGSTAWNLELGDDLVVWVHQDTSHLIDEVLLATPDGMIEVGVNRGFETIKFTQVNDMHDALVAAMGYILEGAGA